MDLLTLIAGPAGAAIACAIGFYLLYTGKLRRAEEVHEKDKQLAEKDKRIAVLAQELELERRTRFDERRVRQQAMDSAKQFSDPPTGSGSSSA
jgi:CRISPR/Cas system-associated endonuclease/helicase Cas3